MTVSLAKENILKKIRQALSNPVPLPFPNSEGSQSVFYPSQEDLTILFAENFNKIQGRFSFCSSIEELSQQLQDLFLEREWNHIHTSDPEFQALLHKPSYQDLASCDVSITGCEYLIARTGSMVLCSNQKSGRTQSVYAPVHICIAFSHQIVFDIRDALIKLKEKYQGLLPSMISFASGPSRTADIEKTLVTGVHGPKEVYCFLVDA